MEKKYWYQKQLRMVQTVLREPDIVNYDAKGVVKFLKEMNANSIIVNAGGIVDFFHTGLEGTNVNPFMTNEDMLGDLIRECHKENIAVICRIDFRGAERHFYRSHPDWFAVDEQGQPKKMSERIGSEVEIYTPCYNSRYMNEHAQEFLDALFTKYDCDGIWENAVSVPYGVCYCERCRTRYKKEMGRPIPSSREMEDPEIYEQYRQWKYKCAEEHIAGLRATVKKYGEDKAYAAEIFGYFSITDRRHINVVDLPMGQKNFDFFVTPAFVSQQGNPNDYPSGLVLGGSLVKYMKMISPEKQAVHLFGTNGGTIRYVRDPEMENKIWVWESAAAGGGFWDNLFNGQHPGATHDTRAAYLAKPIYDFLLANEELLEENAPVADAALYTSKATVDIMGNIDPKQDGVLLGMKGTEKILTEKHIQFVHLPSNHISLDAMKRYKVIILPNMSCLSDREVELLRQYVAEGGNLISTFETSAYDENGNKHSDLALGDVFGVSSTGMTIDTSIDCYQLIRMPDHPLLKGITNTELLGSCEKTLLVNATEGTQCVTTYIPIIQNQPPEKAWIRDMRTDYPVVAVNHFGKGTSIYFANMLARGLHTYAHDDFVQLFGNALDMVLEAPVVETNAPASVHVQTIQVKGGLMVSLINHTGTMYRPVREVVPVHDIQVKVHTAAVDTRVLYDSVGGVTTAIGETEVTVTVPKLDEFVSIYIKTR